jgi:hypothetical protein
MRSYKISCAARPHEVVNDALDDNLHIENSPFEAPMQQIVLALIFERSVRAEADEVVVEHAAKEWLQDGLRISDRATLDTLYSVSERKSCD